MRSAACLKLKEILCVARSSNLSKCQTLEVQTLIEHFYPELRLVPHYLKSLGDVDKTTSLRTLASSNFFTDTIDRALLNDEARVAVHSVKDLPQKLDKGLYLAAITPCLDLRDVLIFADSIDLSKPLPEALRIATSCTHRELAAAQVAPNPRFQDLRGTIEERLAIVERGDADAVVIAWAALMRLKLTRLPKLFLPGPTTPGQGSLAIVVRREDREMIDLFSILDTRAHRPRCYYLGIDPSSYESPFKLIHAPAIVTCNRLQESPELQARFLKAYEEASHVLLTSPRCASYSWQFLMQHPQLMERAQDKTWVCIGTSTAKALGPEASLLYMGSVGATAETLVPFLQQLENARVFYPHSRHARPLLQETLKTLNIESTALEIYETLPRAIDRQAGELLEADELIVTSPSCVDSLYRQITPSSLTKVTAIGRVTGDFLDRKFRREF